MMAAANGASSESSADQLLDISEKESIPQRKRQASISDPVSVENYVDKFSELVEAEKNELPQEERSKNVAYFDFLFSAIMDLDKDIIHRLVPTSQSFKKTTKNVDVSLCHEHCSPEQYEAVKIIVNSEPDNPPILLTGVIGSRKSRLLAICSLFLLGSVSSSSIRILVCTQTQVSADKFLTYYKSVEWDKRSNHVFVIDDKSKSSIKDDTIVITSQKMKEYYEEYKSSQKNLLVITKCKTCPNLKYFDKGFFSHIFIDECSHMLEPEAIAPLYFAKVDTKIVLAGDINQVGPANIVRGRAARANNLKVSLLQRLEKMYDPECQIIAKLLHSSRCHPDILDIVGKLFYKSKVKWDERKPLPETHKKYPYPLVFICSSLEEDQFNKHCRKTQNSEVNIIMDKVMELNENLPSSWDDSKTKIYLITSPCSHQIGAMREKFKQSGIEDSVIIKRRFQGQESQVVILSTTEQVNEDGSPQDFSRSFCSPHVFNTAVTRAKSSVIAVGNPFLLLTIEKEFVKECGEDHNAHCWSTFLEFCIARNTLCFDERLGLKKEDELKILDKINHKILAVDKEKINQKKIDQLEKQKLEMDQKYQEMEQKYQEMLKMKQKDKPEVHSSETISSLASGAAILDESQKFGRDIQQTPSTGKPRQIVHGKLPLHAQIRTETCEKTVQFEGSTYTVIDVLGKGRFASVYKVVEKNNTEVELALKIVKYNSGSKKTFREVKALQELSHERIVNYMKHWSRDTKDAEQWCYENSRDNCDCLLFILTELCRKKNLHHWLEENSGTNCRPMRRVTEYFNQILEGVKFIHDKGFVHRDLKPSNIFFSLHTGILKIGDFGLAVCESSRGNDGATSTFGACGTNNYMSPEQFRNRCVDRTDIYALGIILFELFYPRKQYDRTKVLGDVNICHFPTNFEATFPAIYQLIRHQMLHQEPSKRPTAAQLESEFQHIEMTGEFVPICDD